VTGGAPSVFPSDLRPALPVNDKRVRVVGCVALGCRRIRGVCDRLRHPEPDGRHHASVLGWSKLAVMFGGSASVIAIAEATVEASDVGWPSVARVYGGNAWRAVGSAPEPARPPSRGERLFLGGVRERRGVRLGRRRLAAEEVDLDLGDVSVAELGVADP